MNMKKRVVKKGVKRVDRKSILSGAVKDLTVEINKLGKEKSVHKRTLVSVSSAINVDREKEKELQQKIAKLIEREAKLNQKKKKLQTKIDSVSDKINKISKIKSEMADI